MFHLTHYSILRALCPNRGGLFGWLREFLTKANRSLKWEAKKRTCPPNMTSFGNLNDKRYHLGRLFTPTAQWEFCLNTEYIFSISSV